MSERSIQVAVQVAAGLVVEIRERIAAAPIADNTSTPQDRPRAARAQH